MPTEEGGIRPPKWSSGPPRWVVTVNVEALSTHSRFCGCVSRIDQTRVSSVSLKMYGVA